MSEIKYTTDGKKVVVIGDLNQTEKIVQEIFVTDDGTETPMGEMFVVKSLLDKPAKSWKEKELEELENRYESEKKYWEQKFDKLRGEKEQLYQALCARVKWLRNVAKEPHPQTLKDAITTLADFLSPTEKWVIVGNYSSMELAKFDDDGINFLDKFEWSSYGYGHKRYDSMRLLSLYGYSNGDLQYNVNEYSDGSGSDKSVKFFRSREAGIEYMQKYIDSVEEYNSSHIDMAKKYGLILDADKVAEYNRERKERILKNINKCEEDLKIYKQKLEEFE